MYEWNLNIGGFVSLSKGGKEMKRTMVLAVVLFAVIAAMMLMSRGAGAIQLASEEGAILSMVNAERVKAGLAPLEIDDRLVEQARLKAKDMALKGYFSHTSPTYGSPFDQLKAAGITYKAAGENIGRASSATMVFDAWMNSSGHKANILGSSYNKIGIGSYNGYYVQLFIKDSTVSTNTAIYHTVVSGDTLWNLSQKYGTTMTNIRNYNRLTTDALYLGQRLIVGYRSPNSTTQYRTHTVKVGESLWLIANQYGLSVAQLKGMNGLTSDYLYAGQVLKVGYTVASSYTKEEVDLLARMVAAESRGEPYSGQVAVAAVILNRTKSGRFPTSIKDVLFQPYQFEPVLNGEVWQVEVTSTQYKAVEEAINGKDPSNGSLFFWNPRTAASRWLLTNTKIMTVIGNHEFRTYA